MYLNPIQDIAQQYQGKRKTAVPSAKTAGVLRSRLEGSMPLEREPPMKCNEEKKPCTRRRGNSDKLSLEDLDREERDIVEAAFDQFRWLLAVTPTYKEDNVERRQGACLAYNRAREYLRVGDEGMLKYFISALAYLLNSHCHTL